MTQDFKSVLITGATGDIGRAITKSFINSKCNKIVISGIEDDILKKMVEELSTPETEIKAIKCNFMNKEEVEGLIEKTVNAVGHIDFLINNAGINRDNLLMRMTDDEWDMVMKINLESCFRLCRSVVRSMISQKHGRIVNISSVVAFMGNIGQSNYCASKAGLIGFSKALAQELASRNITVNCVAPGFIDSNMTNNIPEKVKEKLLSSIPMKRTGTPEEIAAAVNFLTSDYAGYITGTTIHVNGGLYLA